jgi:hypothetical protein
MACILNLLQPNAVMGAALIQAMTDTATIDEYQIQPCTS